MRQFFYRHGSRSKERIEARLREIRQARPAIADAAVVEPCALMLQVLLPVMAALKQGVTQLQRAGDEVFAAHDDAPVFNSFPGAGPVMRGRLLAAFGSRRDRWASAAEIQSYSGIAPITIGSGTHMVHFRCACPKFLRQTFHEYAALSIQQCQWARDFYDHRRQIEKTDRHAAIRSLAYKWQRIMFRCWKDRTPYRESVYEEALLRGRPSAPAQAGKPAPAQEPSRSKLGLIPENFVFKKVAGFWKLSAAAS